MPFKIRTKLITAFIGLISVTLGITGGIAYYNQRALHKAIQCSEDADERMQLVNIFQIALGRALMPGNDYIITGDRKYVSEFETASYGMENGIKMVEESMAHLRGSLKAGEMKEEEEVFRDVKLAWQNIKDISLKIFAIPDPARDKTAARLMEEMDYKWAYPAVKRLDRLDEISRKGHREGIEAVYKAWRRSWIIMGGGALFLFAAGVSFALLYSGLFVGLIKRLHNGADAVARGEFKTRLDIKTGDELQQLSVAMNEMAEQLDSFYGTLERQVEDRTKELKESEEHYRSLFENMLEGFAYCKMLFDDQDRPVDFVYLNVNASFERLTGLKNVVGKQVTEVIPGIKEAHSELFEIYGRVALTGKPESFELDFKPLEIWLSISVYSPERGCFVAVFDNITERKKAEAALKQRINELEQFRKVTIKRELRMEELQRKVEEMEKKLGVGS